MKVNIKKKTGFLSHESYLWHFYGPAALYIPAGGIVEPDKHCEAPDTKRRFRNIIEMSGLSTELEQLSPTSATDEDILRFHTPEYLRRVQEIDAAGGGDAGAYAILNAGSYEIARLSAGGAITAINAVTSGQVRNAYALLRPPGHHAEAEKGLGFCIFGNAAIAIMHAWAHGSTERVVVVDWDVHHGNGTQQAFYDSADVLTISIHQDNLFPLGSGAISETGESVGEGCNINVPLPPGCGVGAYFAVMERIVIPAIYNFKPDLIVVCSGFDSCAADPLGRMMVHSDGYRAMTALLMEAADVHCDGRILMIHEGGYSSAYVPFCGLAVMEQLSGIDTGHEDPFLPFMTNYGYMDLQPHQEAIIEIVRPLVDKLR